MATDMQIQVDGFQSRKKIADTLMDLGIGITLQEGTIQEVMVSGFQVLEVDITQKEGFG